MASFVREVLSATGRLGEKENFSGKASRLQNRVDDLKSNLRERIEARYEDFSGSFAEVSTAVLQLEDVIKEVESLEHSISTHLKPNLNDANREAFEISRQLRDLSHSVQIANLTKSAYEALEEASELLYAKKYSEAASRLQCVSDIITKIDVKDDEDTKRSIEAIKKEYGTLQDKTSYILGKDWDENVQVVPKFSQDNDEILESATLKFGYLPGDGSLRQLVQAMHSSDILSFRMKRFCQSLINYIIKPLTSKRCQLQANDNAIYLQISHGSSVKCLDVISSLETILYFIAKSFDFEVAGNSFNTTIGNEIGEKMIGNLLTNCLIPAVPDKKDHLDDFNIVINAIKSFESTMVDLKFLTLETTKALRNFWVQIDQTFVKKRCTAILVKARQLMKMDLHQTVTLEAKSSLNQSEAEETFKTEFNVNIDMDEEEALLPLPIGISLNDGLFKFPTCQVSVSMIEVVKLVEEVLDEVTAECKIEEECDVRYAGRLLMTVRNIFEMYNDVLPVSHSQALKDFPINSAIGYNNCMYLAHQCLQIFIPTENLPKPLKDRPMTFADLVPRLRQTGIEVFLSQLRRLRDQYRSMLRDSTTGFGQLDGSNLLPTSSEKCLRQVLHQLMHLKSLWQDALPLSIFRRSIGLLLNTVVEELVQKVLVLEDIAADAAVQICMHFTVLQDQAPELFVIQNNK